jgi:hypothetical protein
LAWKTGIVSVDSGHKSTAGSCEKLSDSRKNTEFLKLKKDVRFPRKESASRSSGIIILITVTVIIIIIIIIII